MFINFTTVLYKPFIPMSQGPLIPPPPEKKKNKRKDSYVEKCDLEPAFNFLKAVV